jgi:hypothetical protein
MTGVVTIGAIAVIVSTFLDLGGPDNAGAWISIVAVAFMIYCVGVIWYAPRLLSVTRKEAVDFSLAAALTPVGVGFVAQQLGAPDALLVGGGVLSALLVVAVLVRVGAANEGS